MRASTLDSEKIRQSAALFESLKPSRPIRIGLIEDDPTDVLLFSTMLKQSGILDVELETFSDLNALLKAGSDYFDVLVLDRFIQNDGLSEGRIREVKALHPHAGVIMYTNSDNPRLRANAVQEGAFAVVEKGRLTPDELELLIMTAACIGTKVTN